MMKILTNDVANLPLLRFPHKKIRASVIREYMQNAGYDRAVCFSCGNAARALVEAGVNTLHIGKNGVLAPKKWFSVAEVRNIWPSMFDATSGHLSASLMVEIGLSFRKYLGNLSDTVYVPTGSGETLCCLKMAYPQTDFIAVYNIDEATEYSEFAPLNAMVLVMAKEIIMAEE